MHPGEVNYMGGAISMRNIPGAGRRRSAWCMDASGGKRLAEIAARVGALLACSR